MTHYQYQAISITGFIQQLAVNYCGRGYYHFVVGEIPAAKDPLRTDEKLLGQYDIALSGYKCLKSERKRRRQKGLAALQYLRFKHRFVIVATDGRHTFYEQEANIGDCRKRPLKIFGYSIRFVNAHMHIRIEKRRFAQIKKQFTKYAMFKDREFVETAFKRLPFYPYAPIRSQYLVLFRHVNRIRKIHNLPTIDRACVNLNQKYPKVFG